MAPATPTQVGTWTDYSDKLRSRGIAPVTHPWCACARVRAGPPPAAAICRIGRSRPVTGRTRAGAGVTRCLPAPPPVLPAKQPINLPSNLSAVCPLCLCRDSTADEEYMVEQLKSGAIKALVLDSTLMNYISATDCEVAVVGSPFSTVRGQGAGGRAGSC